MENLNQKISQIRIHTEFQPTTLDMVHLKQRDGGEILCDLRKHCPHEEGCSQEKAYTCQNYSALKETTKIAEPYFK